MSGGIVRRGGMAAMAAGVLLVVGALLPTSLRSKPPYPPTEYLYDLASTAGYALLLVGLLGLRARHVGAGSWTAERGFRVAFAGTATVAALGPIPNVAETLAGRALPVFVGAVLALYVLALLVAEIGLLLLGLGVLRARLLPMPWRALPLAIFFVGLPLAALMLVVLGFEASTEGPVMLAPDMLTGVGWVLLGYALFSGVGEGIGHSSPTSLR